MIRCLDCGESCVSEDALFMGKEGCLLAHAWYCDKCMEGVDEMLTKWAQKEIEEEGIE